MYNSEAKMEWKSRVEVIGDQQNFVSFALCAIFDLYDLAQYKILRKYNPIKNE